MVAVLSELAINQSMEFQLRLGYRARREVSIDVRRNKYRSIYDRVQLGELINGKCNIQLIGTANKRGCTPFHKFSIISGL